MKKIILFLISLVLLGFFMPFALRFVELSKLQNKVLMVNRFLDGDEKYDDVKSMIQISVGHHYKSLEKSIDSYLLDVVEQFRASEDLIHDSEYELLFSEENLANNAEKLQESMNTIKNHQEKLIEVKEDLKNLSYKKTRNSYSSSKYLNLYKRVFHRFHNPVLKDYVDSLDGIVEEMNLEVEQFEFLVNHSDSWIIVDHVIEFQKRNAYVEFQEITKDQEKFVYRIVNDTTGPVIEGEGATIYLNNSINIEERVHCYDEVDGELSCTVEGTYDNTKVGDYPITIRSVDASGNMSEKVITIKVIRLVNTKPYEIDVIRNQNVVIVYYLDEEGNRSGVAKVFVCSTGIDNATPTGTFYTTKGGTWGSLYGGVWGQYTTRIVGSILFHSVPYFSRNKGDLEWEEYNKLGTQASLGCVRLAVRDVKWIFYNCPSGTKVHIYDGDIPAGIGKPSAIKIDGSNPNRGWDPTDDDPLNPWR